MSNSAKRYRNFCFTINNYTDSQISGLNNYTCNYLVYGLEIGELGTPHIQGYIEFTNPKTISAFNKSINCKKNKVWANCEPRRGKPKEASGYCKKGTRDAENYSVFFDNPSPDWNGKEFGIISAQGERTDLKEMVTAISNGETSVEDIIMEQPEYYHKYGRTLDKATDILMRKQFRTSMTKGTWYYGKTGVGKSHLAFEGYHPDTHYLFKDDKNWQDGYCQQKIVIINDFRGNIPYEKLLTLVDKYPHTLSRRGREPMPFTSEHVIITSSLPPEKVYWRRDEEDSLDQLYRRFEVFEITRDEEGSLDSLKLHRRTQKGNNRPSVHFSEKDIEDYPV